MVVRRTNRHIIVQMVIAEMDGDKTLVSANSAELEKYGYTGATANTPAAYLTGLLFAAKAKKAGQDRAILDIGLNRATPGARVFAALKGAVDAGLEIPYGEGIIPSEERIKGEHIAAHNKNASDIVKNVEQVADAIKKELV